MTIKVTYNNYTVVKYDNFDEITNNMNVININCRHNNLKSLPGNMMFPNLTHFDCSYNNLSSLPQNMVFPDLILFNCSYNKLISLPPNMMFPNLIHFNCSYNNLYYIPPHINCHVDTDDNTKSPEYMRRKLLI